MSLLREITERYRLEKILRSTRSGSVLRATDALGGGTVVVKLVSLGAEPVAAGGRFSTFAGRLAGEEHPSLPVLRDFGLTTDGSAFLVMEHLEGRGAASLAGTDPKRIVGAMLPVAEGLALLAARGLFHGNLSPDNLFLATGPGELKMLGLATALLRVPGPAAGGDNARFRAPEELAPATGSGEPWRADVYSFAATLCHLLEVPLPLGPAELGQTDPGAPVEIPLPLSLAFQLEDAEPLRRFLAAALAGRPEARPDFAAAREAMQRALHAAPPAGRSIEETRPAFLAESLEPTPERTPPAALTPTDRASTAIGGDMPPAAAAPPLALAAEALPALEPESPRPAIPEPPKIAIPEPPKIAIPEPLRIAIPEPPKIAIPESLRMAIPEPPKPLVPPPAAAFEEDGEALSAVDDDMLAALTAAPPKPAAPSRGAAAPRPTKSGGYASPPAPGATAGWKERLVKPLPLGAAFGLLLLLGAGLFFWSRGGTPPATAAPGTAGALGTGAAAAAAPAPPPLPPPAERLRTAEEALAAGDDHASLVALRSITPAEQRTLPAEACRQIQSLEEILALTAPGRLAGDLESGWKTGNLDLLRMAAREAADQPAAAAVLPAAMHDTLDRARRAADLYDLAETALRQNDSPRALQSFGELAHLLPSFRDGSGLRDRAATEILGAAGKLVADARYEEALAKLEPLRQSWPERPGLKAEVETIRDQEKNEQTLANLLAEADNAEKRRRPDEGIDLLKKVKPTPHLEAPYRAQMARLETLLERVDSRPPTIALRDGFLLDYDRGTVANLSFRVRDDYKVQTVKIYARGGGGRMVEMPYKRDGFVYDVEIQPSFHQNGTVDFYVVATDYSGHESSLGSRDKPLQLKRRKGFRET